MKKSNQVLALFCISFSLFAKAPQPECAGVNGPVFTVGDGSVDAPYLICNHKQFKRLTTETELLSQHFKLGTNLNFANRAYTPIASVDNPFVGGFDGDGYMLSNITLPTPVGAGYNAPFRVVKNATFKNLTIKGMTLPLPGGGPIAGGIIGEADGCTLSNLKVKELNMGAPDRSGGVVGKLANSTLVNSSSEGKMFQHFGTDASGGLAGHVSNSIINACSSNVLISTTTRNPFGVGSIGGLIGSMLNSEVSNVYAIGDIDYSLGLESTGPQVVGGLVGAMISSTIEYAYYAGKITINAEHLGGAVGVALNPETPVIPVPTGETVYWDTEVSGIAQSAVGEGHLTSTLKTKQFWEERAFNGAVWIIKEGRYPRLKAAVE